MIKDYEVSLWFDSGMYTSITVKGYMQELVHAGTGERSFREVSGKDKFLIDAETKTFLDLGNEAYRYKDLCKVHFREIIP